MFANQDMVGMTLFIPAHAVTYPGKSSMENVFVLPLKLFGTTTPKLAPAPPKLMVITVFPAPLPEFGITPTTNVFAPPLKLNGTDKSVFAQLEDTDPTVLNALPPGIGMMLPTNVFVTLPSSGTVKTVSALNPGSYGKEDVLNAQMDSNGSITDAKNATALGNNWMF